MHVNEFEQVLKNECILHTVCHAVKFNSESLTRIKPSNPQIGF